MVQSCSDTKWSSFGKPFKIGPKMSGIGMVQMGNKMSGFQMFPVFKCQVFGSSTVQHLFAHQEVAAVSLGEEHSCRT